MHIGTRYGLNLEAWDSRHSGDVSSREQAREGGLTAGQCRYETMIYNVRAPSGSVMVCWTTTQPREFCGRKTSENKLLGINS